MRTAAAIPIKNLQHAKSRLSPLLSPALRQELCLAMLLDMLDCLGGVGILEDIFIVCGDDFLCNAIKNRSPQIRLLEEDCSLNEAASYAMAALCAQGIDRMLFLHGDLPLISGKSIEALLQAAPTNGVLLLSDKTHRGTNGIVATPPDILGQTAFGVGSLKRHEALCDEHGIPVGVFHSEETSFDVDDPQDLLRLSRVELPLRSAALLRPLATAPASSL